MANDNVVTIYEMDNNYEHYNTSGQPLICLRVPDGVSPSEFRATVERLLGKAGFVTVDYFDPGAPGSDIER